MTKSTYFFIGKLSDNLAKYQIQEMSLKNEFRIEIFLNGICIWGTTSKNFDEIMPEIKEAPIHFQLRELTSFEQWY